MTVPNNVSKIEIFVAFDNPEIQKTFTMSDFGYGHDQEDYDLLKQLAYDWIDLVKNNNPVHSTPGIYVVFEMREQDTLPYPPTP